MPNPLALTLHASAVQATSGQSATFDLLATAFAADGLRRRIAELLLEVTAASGTAPTLNVTIETSPNPTSWQPVLAFKSFTDVGFQRLKFGPLERYLRAKWVIGGTTPSFTLQITGDAHVVYAAHDDFFVHGLPRIAVPDPTDPVDLLSGALLGASSNANAQIPRAHTLPLKDPYPESLKRCCCKLAAFDFLTQRGFDPDDPADKEVVTAAKAAEKWLDSLGGGVEPDWVDATPDEYDAGAYMSTRPRRGW
jgi:hypothetical protein